MDVIQGASKHGPGTFRRPTYGSPPMKPTFNQSIIMKIKFVSDWQQVTGH